MTKRLTTSKKAKISVTFNGGHTVLLVTSNGLQARIVLDDEDRDALIEALSARFT